MKFEVTLKVFNLYIFIICFNSLQLIFIFPKIIIIKKKSKQICQYISNKGNMDTGTVY